MLGQPAAEPRHRGNHVLPSLSLLAQSETSKLGRDIYSRRIIIIVSGKRAFQRTGVLKTCFFDISCALLHQTNKSRVILVNKIYCKMVFVSLALQEGAAGGEPDSLC